MAITLNGTTGVTTTGLTSNGIDDNATSTAITIDTSGNLLVGKTSNAFGTAGVALSPSGSNNMTRAGDPPLALNRLTSDGDILGFYKDGSTVGSIGTLFGDLYVATGNTGIRCVDANRSISAYDSNLAALVRRTSWMTMRRGRLLLHLHQTQVGLFPFKVTTTRCSTLKLVIG